MSDFNLNAWIVPLCDDELVEAVLAVRGEQGLLTILTAHFNLRATAQFATGSLGDAGYSLVLDSEDRYKNPSVGLSLAIETVLAGSAHCLHAEISSWSLSDFQHVESWTGAKALVGIGVIHKGNVQHCSTVCRDVFFARDLGL